MVPSNPLLIAQLDAMHRSRGGDWYYRTFAPGRAMAELPDVYVVNVDQAHRKLPRILELADVLVVNGVCSADLLPVIVERKRAALATVFEINDDVQAIQASNPLAGFFARPETIRLFRRLALSCDAVQYSVEELQRLYGSLNSRGRIFHNQLVDVPPLGAANDAGVNVGWGGSAGHLEDMAEVASDLVTFVLAHPQVTVCLMCSERIWRLFDALPASRKRLTPPGSIDDYYAFVRTLDIGIAPNRDAGFNRARSDVKFLEYAGYGAVPVVQRLAPYAATVQDGQTGFFFDSNAELIAHLTRLVHAPEERQRVRAAAHRYAATERRQAAHAAERLAFYAELVSPRHSPAPQLFAELSALEGAEISGRHCMLGHGRFETLLHDGVVLLQQSSEQAAPLLHDAEQLEPQHYLPQLFLGLSRGDETALLAALQKNPRSVQALLALGSIHLEKGRFRAALERFLAAAELAPAFEMPFAYAAQAMQKLGAVKEAAEFDQISQQLASAVLPAQAR